MYRRVALVGLMFVMVVSSASPAWARKPKPGGAGPTGYDVSYPQCNGALPSAPLFGVVGVNDGIVYSANPCLAAEYTWAESSSATTTPKVSFYANTADPGPTSSHWPTGQTTPRPCTSPATLTTACSYDYGWNAAADSFADVARVAGAANATSAPWWLDIETANSWTSDTANNIADVQGALDYLTTPVTQGGAGVTGGAGIYTNSSSWQTITGSTSMFSSDSSWVPGATNLAAAKANCSASVTGGPVRLSQYPSGGFDADFACP